MRSACATTLLLWWTPPWWHAAPEGVRTDTTVVHEATHVDDELLMARCRAAAELSAKIPDIIVAVAKAFRDNFLSINWSPGKRRPSW